MLELAPARAKAKICSRLCTISGDTRGLLHSRLSSFLCVSRLRVFTSLLLSGLGLGPGRRSLSFKCIDARQTLCLSQGTVGVA